MDIVLGHDVKQRGHEVMMPEQYAKLAVQGQAVKTCTTVGDTPGDWEWS